MQSFLANSNLEQGRLAPLDKTALAADPHHTHTLNILSTGHRTKTTHRQHPKLFSKLLKVMGGIGTPGP